MKTLLTLGAVATLGLGLAGCDSKAEKEVNRQAEAIDESYEAQADVVEAMGKGSPDEEAAKKQAEELRKQGDQTEKHLKEMAKEEL